MSIFRKLLPHVNIILGLMFITFFILDKFNGAMNFIGNDISKGLLLLFALVSIVNAGFVIQENRRRARRNATADAGAERTENTEKSGQTGNSKGE